MGRDHISVSNLMPARAARVVDTLLLHLVAELTRMQPLRVLDHFIAFEFERDLREFAFREDCPGAEESHNEAGHGVEADGNTRHWPSVDQPALVEFGLVRTSASSRTASTNGISQRSACSFQVPARRRQPHRRPVDRATVRARA